MNPSLSAVISRPTRCTVPPWVIGVLCLGLIALSPLCCTARAQSADADGNASSGGGGNVSLDQSVVVAENLTNNQRQTIQQYVQGQLGRLNSEDGSAVTDARTKLIIPLNNPGATDAFREAYVQSVDQGIESAVQSESWLTRLNTAIVLSRLSSTRSAELATGLLRDDNPAVRYWAAQAIGEIAQSGGLSGPAQRELLQDLDQMVGQESSADVLGKIFQAMLAIPTTQGRNAVLQALNNRLRFHANNPNAPYTAEREAMSDLFRAIITAQSNNQMDPQDLRRLTRLSVLYTELIGRNLAQGRVTQAGAQENHTRLLTLAANSILPFAVDTLSIPGNPPASLRNDILSPNWPGVQRDAQQWKGLLTNAAWQYAYTDDQLQLPEPAGQEGGEDQADGGNAGANTTDNG